MVPTTDYINTIAPENEPSFPGDEEVERRYRAWIRWNAAVTVHRAQRPGIGVGGHISTYASSASLYEVGFNHFFKGARRARAAATRSSSRGHASPGIYARSFLEGACSEEQLDGFRQEESNALPASRRYPHPRLRCRTTGSSRRCSMGTAARSTPSTRRCSNKYLAQPRHQGHLAPRTCGPSSATARWTKVESRGQLAGRPRTRSRQPHLRHQLQPAAPRRPGARQRQDHPGARVVLPRCRAGTSSRSCGVANGTTLLARDADGALLNIMNSTPDGDYQTYHAEYGAYMRDNFFGRTSARWALVKGPAPTSRSGSCPPRRSRLPQRCTRPTRRPSSTRASPPSSSRRPSRATGLGPHFEGRNATHQMKKMTLENLKTFRDTMHIPITDAQLEENPVPARPYYQPRARRTRRSSTCSSVARTSAASCLERRSTHVGLELPGDAAYALPKKGSGTQEIATTMAFVRLLKDLLRSKDFGHRIVPIIPGRGAHLRNGRATSRRAKIYNPNGQHYTVGRPRTAPGLQGDTAGPDRARRHQRSGRGRRVHRGWHRRTPRTANR